MFILEILIPILSILICVAYYTLAERKIIASIQRRQGPNVVGVLGLLQPIIDGVKAVLKEQITPLRGIIFLFILAPFLCFFISLLLLNFLSFSYTRGYFDEYLNMILFLAISSFNIFGLIFAGWSSNSKYALLGSIRGTAQIFSFEMCFISLLLPIFLLNSTFNILDIIIYQNNYYNIFLFLPNSIYFFIIILAETNRIPFDLAEAEAELVAGYNVEYSSINFAVFFLAEYTNMLLNSFLYVFFFLGSWNNNLYFKLNYLFEFFSTLSISPLGNLIFLKILPVMLLSPLIFFLDIWFHKYLSKILFIPWIFIIIKVWNNNLFFSKNISQDPNKNDVFTDNIYNNSFFFELFNFLILNIKVVFIACIFIFVRALIPRYRFDQLMNICWKKILPVSFSFFIYFIFLIYFFNGFLYNLEIDILGNPYLQIYIFSTT